MSHCLKAAGKWGIDTGRSEDHFINFRDIGIHVKPESMRLLCDPRDPWSLLSAVHVSFLYASNLEENIDNQSIPLPFFARAAWHACAPRPRS